MRAFLITGFNKRIQIMIAGRHAVFVITVFRTNVQRADSSPECVGYGLTNKPQNGSNHRAHVVFGLYF